MSPTSAIVVGAGPGLGAALCRRFLAEGLAVAAVRRSAEGADAVAADTGAHPYPADATDGERVREVFGQVTRELGPPELVVFNAGGFQPGTIRELSAETFEAGLRGTTLAGFNVGQAAAQTLGPRGHGTIIFTGATASVRGGKNFPALAAPKFGLRALAQCLARDLQPEGIHVAHTIVDGQIRNEHRGGRYSEAERGPDALLHPEAIADAYWQLHRQPRNAWTHELDLRPYVEPF